MNYPVEVFQIAGAKPNERPLQVDGFAVTADTVDEARRMVFARFAAEGRPVRSVSFTAGGGIAAVVLPADAARIPQGAAVAAGGRR